MDYQNKKPSIWNRIIHYTMPWAMWMWNFMRKHMAASVIIVIALLFSLYWIGNKVISVMTDYAPSVNIKFNDKIDITPEEIRSIKDIGEWEFFSMDTEELIDTTRRGIFISDNLTRIYYGTLRLGINTKEMSGNWFKARHDTALLILPKIKLLDTRFIDESRTRAFYQSGTWAPRTREDMYRRAQKKMMKRVLTPANYKAAEQNRNRQFTDIFKAFGFKEVIIEN